jgi:hypothetical protein
MSKVLKAEDVDATASVRVPDNASVVVHHATGKPPWSDLRGLLSLEEGEEFARIIEEAFPTEPVKK